MIDRQIDWIRKNYNAANKPVKSAGSEECRVESIGSVSSHDNFDVDGLIEAVHLIEKLEEDSLDFSVGASLGVKTFRRDRVDLVNEDDGWEGEGGGGEIKGRREESGSEEPGEGGGQRVTKCSSTIALLVGTSVKESIIEFSSTGRPYLP